MELYIQVENDKPVNHPALKENLLQAFGTIPDNWKRFVRVGSPNVKLYEVLESNESTYEFVDGVWTDVWKIREMTSEEKLEKQNLAKEIWNSKPNRENFSAWTFDEEVCEFVPPTPKPINGKEYYWDGALNLWKEIPLP
jgi:hypothetical protein